MRAIFILSNLIIFTFHENFRKQNLKRKFLYTLDTLYALLHFSLATALPEHLNIIPQSVVKLFKYDVLVEYDPRWTNRGIYVRQSGIGDSRRHRWLAGIRKRIGRTRPGRFIVRMVEGRRRYQGSRFRPREIDKVCHREGSPQPSSQVNSASQLFSNRKLLKWLSSSLKIDFVYADVNRVNRPVINFAATPFYDSPSRTRVMCS